MWRSEKEEKKLLIKAVHELKKRVTEVEEDNKKLSHQIEDKVDQLRKSGL